MNTKGWKRMSNIYVYGRAFTFTYYPVDLDGNPISASADNPAIYLFAADTYPSIDNCRDGTDAIQTITSWSTSGNGYQISIDAISDPNPNEEPGTRDFHLGINFTTEASEQVQTRRIHFRVSRPLGFDEELNVTQADLEAYFNTVDSWISTTNQDNFISEATKWAKSKLEDKGYNYYKVRNPSKLRFLVIQRALNRLSLSQVSQGNNGFETLYEETKNEVESELSTMKLAIDADGSGDADTETTLSSHIRLMV